MQFLTMTNDILTVREYSFATLLPFSSPYCQWS